MGEISLKLNGKLETKDVADNTLLIDFIREHVGLTGTHVGCDTSQCGACVIHLDGVSVKACTMLAKQAEGSEIVTIEGLADGDELHPMQQAFHENHGLQCGFCTPGMVMSAVEMVTKNKNISEDEIRTVSYTHLRAHETRHEIVCRLLLEKKKFHVMISVP